MKTCLPIQTGERAIAVFDSTSIEHPNFSLRFGEEMTGMLGVVGGAISDAGRFEQLNKPRSVLRVSRHSLGVQFVHHRWCWLGIIGDL